MKGAAESLLEQLNSQQVEAVQTTDGPVLVLAGAGSGKTRVITFKVAYIIRQQLAGPDEVLAVTFTNKAAEEMRERVLRLVGDLPSPPLVSTFHSFCVRLLRRHAPKLGWGHDFAIFDAEDQLSVYRQAFNLMQLEGDDAPAPRVARSVVSAAKNKGWDPDDYQDKSGDRDAELMARIFRTYQRLLKESNAMDFDDLILHSVRLMREFQGVREQISSRFRFLLIDEYQDTNQPQYELIRFLTGSHQNLTAVGDEDQSIYRFRGADIENILRFENDFPGAQIIKLERNYRSTQVILDAATAVVSRNLKRKGKVLWTEEAAGEPIELFVGREAADEAYFVGQTIRELMASGQTAVAVLYRTNFQSRLFEEALLKLNVPYRLVGGVSFYSRKEIKDALGYLRYLRNPRDTVSLLRIINQPPRGLGKRTLERLQNLAEAESLSLHEALEQALKENSLASRAHAALSDFMSVMQRCRTQLETQALHVALERILDLTGYWAMLDDQAAPEAKDRRMNLEELLTVAREFDSRGEGAQSFLDSCALYAESDAYDASSDVHLMTLHNAKGLEFDTVFLAGLEEGLFPHALALEEDGLEEERRLCYVGFTRARRKLFLSYARRRRRFGKDSSGENHPSRFLSEVPRKLLQARTPVAAGAVPISASRFQHKKSKFTGRPTYDTPESVAGFLEKLPGSRRLRAGAIVEHARFGRGRVLHVEDTGNDWKVTVHFSEIGIKKVLQSYAQLRPI